MLISVHKYNCFVIITATMLLLLLIIITFLFICTSFILFIVHTTFICYAKVFICPFTYSASVYCFRFERARKNWRNSCLSSYSTPPWPQLLFLSELWNVVVHCSWCISHKKLAVLNETEERKKEYPKSECCSHFTSDIHTHLFRLCFPFSNVHTLNALSSFNIPFYCVRGFGSRSN